MAKPYAKRLRIPVDPRENGCHWEIPLFTRSSTPIARGYRRVVIGKRGPYVEFHFTDIDWKFFYIPDEELYRTTSKVVFYEEWRSLDDSYVKLYLQKKTVAYADYKIHMMYISPFDLLDDQNKPIIA